MFCTKLENKLLEKMNYIYGKIYNDKIKLITAKNNLN